jgi:hypothetical protein
MLSFSIIFLIVSIFFVIFSLLYSTIYSNVQTYLDNKAQNKQISLYTQPIFGLCPNEWKKNNYKNGNYCISPEAYAIIDTNNNFISAKKGTCTLEKTLSPTLVNDLNLDHDKKYFCQTL